MSTEEKIKYWKGYCYNVFATFNGWINPVCPASCITFDYYVLDQNEMSLGRTVIDEINVNLLSIFDYCSLMGYNTDAQIKGILTYVILHELSHCDQRLDYCDNAKYAIQEISNDQHVAHFVYDNRDQIAKLIGELDPSFFDILLKQVANHPFIPFNSVTSLLDKLIDLLRPFINPDYRGLLENPIYNIRLKFEIKGQVLMLDIRSNEVWPQFYQNIEIVKSIVKKPNFEYTSFNILRDQTLLINISVENM